MDGRPQAGRTAPGGAPLRRLRAPRKGQGCRLEAALAPGMSSSVPSARRDRDGGHAVSPQDDVPRRRYRGGVRLGGGGMAEVFRGIMTGAEGFERPVAIKRILPSL